jgi:hypothetical protein
MIKKQRLGIIQSRGCGDIIIALPIARFYHDQGWHVHWPVTDIWVEQLEHHAPWVKWIPIKADSGEFFYDIPMERLKNFKCDEIICLYQALSGHPELVKEPYFQHTSFDQYKYIRAGVPFLHKWRLAECITRDAAREQAMYDRVVQNEKYVVTHLTASHSTAGFDASVIPEDWQIIPITNDGYIFDWLKVIELAESIVMTDSVMANLVDQLNIGNDRYFIPLNHIQLTPVFGNDWTWLDNPTIDSRVKIFKII